MSTRQVIVDIEDCDNLENLELDSLSEQLLGADHYVITGTPARFDGRWGKKMLRGQEGTFRGVTLSKE